MMPVMTEVLRVGSIRDILQEQTRILAAIHSHLRPVIDAVAEVYRAEVFLDDWAYRDNERVLVLLVAYSEGTPRPDSIVVSIPVALVDSCDVPALVLWVREHAATYEKMIA